LFYIKRTKLLKNGEAPIYLKIRVDKQSTELAIFKSVNPRLWSAEKSGAMGTSDEAKDVNKYIDYVRRQISEHLAKMREEGLDITPIGLKNSLLGKKSDEKRIAEIFAMHNESVRLLVGKDYTQATLQRYETSLLHLRTYIQSKYNVDDIPLADLDPDFVQGFELYLKSARNCNHNTTMKYLKNFKKIVRTCFGNGWIKSDPFTNIKLRLKKVDKGFLTEDELDLIQNKQFSCERLQQVADVFLFGCYTGFAYSDLKRLTTANLVTSGDGRLWIHARRLKTNMESHVPVLPAAMDILNRYRNHPFCEMQNVLLPVLSNQKLNAYLKEIADVCGINKNITTHMARHTFATTITLNNDIPIESVSKMLGHSSISMTQNYAKLLDKKVGKDMSKLYNKYSPPTLRVLYPHSN
jgi:site-specific recombinase XerD